MRALSLEYAAELVALGHLRRDSGPAATLRRLQEFLRSEVYGVLIDVSELSSRIQVGIQTGGRPRER